MANNDPLRAAVIAAEVSLDVERAARAEAYEDDDVSPEEYDEALEQETAAERALEEAREALSGSDCPREWQLTEEGEGYDTIEATSAEEALAEARNVDRSNYSDAEGTIWIDVRVHCEETGEEASDTVTLEPDEPECTEGEHDWQSPHELLGGLRENPGVQGHGGGVVIDEACLHCGCRRTTDTWAQRPDTGEQGLTSVEYEEGCYDVSAYAASRLVPEVSDAGCEEAQEAAAWVLRGLRALLDGDSCESTPAGTRHEERIDEVLVYLQRVYRAVPHADEERALRLALRLAADDDREQRVVEAVIAAQWPAAVRAAA